MDHKKNRKKVIFESESQNLLQKPPNFKEPLYKDILPFANSFSFSFEELLLLKRQYDVISIKGFLTHESFRKSLGLFGLENAPYLSDRIFSIIDHNHDGQADFNDYLSYLDILLNGTEAQKALQSFQIFDGSSQGFLRYQDIEKMVLEICFLWNIMTGEKVTPTAQYISSIVLFFDHDKDGVITLQDYNKTYNHEFGIFGWYEFLNNGSREKEMNLRIKTANKHDNLLFEEKDSNLELSSSDKKNTPGLLSSDLISSMETQILELVEEFQKEQERLEAILSGYDVFSIKGPILDVSRVQGLSGENNEEFFPAEDLKDCTINVSKYPPDTIFNSDMPSSISFVNNEGMGKSWEVEFLEDSIQRLQNLSRQVELLKKSLGMICKPNTSSIRKGDLFKINNSADLDKEDSCIRQKTQKNIPNALNNKIAKITTVRKSLSIYFGHPNWNLVLNMMVGIRASVRKKYRWDYGEIEDQDFKIKLELDLIDKRSDEFDKKMASKFYDYCPRVFEAIRNKFGITNEAYLRSVGPEQLLGDILTGNLSSLTQFCSSGKSGSLFYYSFDGKFILKTISHMEFIFLQKILKPYHEHLMKNSDSLLIKIFGLHKIKNFKSKTKMNKIYIIIMQNLLNTDLRIDLKYDIKGSFYGRTSRVPNTFWDRSIPLKDLDFLEDEMKLLLEGNDKERLFNALEKDSKFFVAHNIIDYSLLIAIHFIPQTQVIHTSDNKKNDLENFAEKCQRGIVSGDKNKIYILGVIDILTNYRFLSFNIIFNYFFLKSIKKKFEYGFKKTLLGKTISCIPPKDYATRFLNFIKEYTIERNDAINYN